MAQWSTESGSAPLLDGLTQVSLRLSCRASFRGHSTCHWVAILTSTQPMPTIWLALLPILQVSPIYLFPDSLRIVEGHQGVWRTNIFLKKFWDDRRAIVTFPHTNQILGLGVLNFRFQFPQLTQQLKKFLTFLTKRVYWQWIPLICLGLFLPHFWKIFCRVHNSRLVGYLNT